MGILLALWIAVLGWLAYVAAPLRVWTAGLAVLLVVGSLLAPGVLNALGWLLWLPLALANIPRLRLRLFSAPLLGMLRQRLPAVSTTEREALEAGGVWWDAELFSGRPDWRRLLDLPKPALSAEEQAFLDGPVERLCGMLNDWQVGFLLNDLPPEVWSYIKRERFFGMIIPKHYGGLGFSAQAHSAVIGKVASRSGSAAVTVMVPNSLGPAELLMHYGSEAQKDYYLPRLVDGREVPCFALTNPYAGSDASSIPDRGVVCYGEYRGQKVLGMRVTWDKRYITLAPVATVLGLAFQLDDPEHLLGDEDYLGITLALIPTDHPGVRIGRRHFPLKLAFQNGPTQGSDVFIPMDMVIGGRERVGQGWRMLMERLAVGRSISLPALAAAASKACARNTGSYARIRKQFRLPIGRFEGVQEPLARIAAETYAVDAARALTAVAIDQGHEPSVISALLKYQSTERQRRVVNDAMDIHGGRAICEGPSNYVANLYQGVPVSITVEGANILTRSMITFGQGATRCHPWLYKEIEAAWDTDRQRGLLAFDSAFGGHVAFLLRNSVQALVHNLTGGRWLAAPVTGPEAPWFVELARASLSFALLADVTSLVLGGELKRRERLSGRFADLLAEMYFVSAMLKRYIDDGRPADDLPLLEYACTNALHAFEGATDAILSNYPVGWLGWVLRRVLLPWGLRRRPPADALGQQLAELLLAPSAVRDRLTAGIYVSRVPQDITGRLEYALDEVLRTEPIEQRITAARREGTIKSADALAARREAQAAGLIGAEEIAQLERTDRAIRAAIDVDDFGPEELRASL